jgi:proteasome lid subunit RPN8/RPN11
VSLSIPHFLLDQIHNHGAASYPEEGAGFLLGTDGEPRQVQSILELPNCREQDARSNRYLISPQDYLRAELEADRLGLTLVGVFHSHPDHPNAPSIYDRDWAQPWFSYTITSIDHGKSLESRTWKLLEDRSGFVEEPMIISI